MYVEIPDSYKNLICLLTALFFIFAFLIRFDSLNFTFSLIFKGQPQGSFLNFDPKVALLFVFVLAKTYFPGVFLTLKPFICKCLYYCKFPTAVQRDEKF